MRGKPTASSPSLTSASIVGQMKHIPTLNIPVASTRPTAELKCQPAASASNHQAEADLERVEVAAPLAEAPALPRGKDVNQAVQGGEGKVVLAGEPKLVPHQKINVVGIKRHGEGTCPSDDETDGLESTAFPDVHSRLEISPMAARQYHFTASDIGGCSMSKSGGGTPANVVMFQPRRSWDRRTWGVRRHPSAAPNKSCRCARGFR